MKVYKGTDKDIKCRGFQYTPGVEAVEEKAELCGCGFHGCEAPLDVLGYYAPGDGSRYFVAELEDVSPERDSDDSKVCGKRITLGAEIGIPGLVKAHIEYVNAKCEKEESSSVRRSANSATGARSANSATGARSANSATGARSANSATGDWSANSATGDWSANSATGDWSANSATGYGSANITTGEASSNAGGEASINVGWGFNNKCKGAVGSFLVLSEWGGLNWLTGKRPLIGAQMVQVDGEKIKANTFYCLKNGEVVEAPYDD